MKKKTLDKIDAALEQIVLKLTEAGTRRTGVKYSGDLPPQEFDALKAAQDALKWMRHERKG